MPKKVSEEKLKDYLEKTAKALEKIKISVPERSYLHNLAQDFLKMANCYYSDALYFYARNDFVNAFACVNYAHGWLDAGARIGLFDVGGDDRLFTLWE